mmetsp:Transcript_1407/g.2552  ORF Transcript_1407/g.2552 Transcript_1407/m.2552 type:complete len:305 (+) Transcript_1407:155-1069(+)
MLNCRQPSGRNANDIASHSFIICLRKIRIDPHKARITSKPRLNELFQQTLRHRAARCDIATAADLYNANFEILRNFAAEFHHAFAPRIPASVLRMIVLPAKVAKHENCRACEAIATVAFGPVWCFINDVTATGTNFVPVIVVDPRRHELQEVVAYTNTLGMTEPRRIVFIMFLVIIHGRRFGARVSIHYHRGWSLHGIRIHCNIPIRWSSPDAGVAISIRTLPKLDISVAVVNIHRGQEIVKMGIAIASEAVERTGHIIDGQIGKGGGNVVVVVWHCLSVKKGRVVDQRCLQAFLKLFFNTLSD